MKLSTRTRRAVLAAALLTACGLAGSALAASDTATTTFQVKLEVTPTCTVTSPTDIDMGSVASNATDASGNAEAIEVTCSKTTPYNIGLAPSTANGGDENGAGNMVSSSTGNTDKVAYTLYQDAGFSDVWGNSTGTNTLTTANGLLVGTGTAQSYPVYAKTTNVNVTPDTYTDTVNVNVTY